jgi:iron complex outermembrane receptor protein
MLAFGKKSWTVAKMCLCIITPTPSIPFYLKILKKKQLFWLLVVCWFSIQTLYAQNDSVLLLEPVLIKGYRFSEFQTGSFLQQISFENNLNSIGQNIHQSLAFNSSIYIKNGGPTLLASTASRGSTAQQTATVWCGIPIESPMLGLNDLSTLPVFLFDGMGVLYGAQSSLFGSGNIGGTIQLNHSKQINKGIHGQVFLQAGSFESFNQGLKVSYAGSKLSMQFKYLHQNALNNFEYEWPGIGIQKMKHAGINQHAVLHEINFNPNQSHAISFKIWLQSNKRFIPDVIGGSIDNAEQTNQFARNILEYKYSKGIYQLQSRTAYFNEMFNYRSISTNNSNSRFYQMSQAIDQTWSLKQHKFLFSTQYLLVNGFVDNYITDKRYQQPSILGTIQSTWFNQKFETQLNVRKQWYNEKSLPLVPSFGFNWKWRKCFSINGNLATGFRMPTMNDLYWKPGGNEQLKPEESKSIEIGASVKHKEFSFRLNIYYKLCTNQITWIANSSGFWQAENIQNAEVKGAELFWQWEKKWKNWNFILKGQHDYCVALNKSTVDLNVYNKQMMYVPKIKHLFQFAIKYRQIALEYIHQYVGQRFYTNDNTAALSDYQIGNIFLQKSIDLKHSNGINLHIGVQNCWNQNYQNILNWPMPKRQLQLTFTYNF